MVPCFTISCTVIMYVIHIGVSITMSDSLFSSYNLYTSLSLIPDLHNSTYQTIFCQCGAYVCAVEEMMCVVCVDVTDGA